MVSELAILEDLVQFVSAIVDGVLEQGCRSRELEMATAGLASRLDSDGESRRRCDGIAVAEEDEDKLQEEDVIPMFKIQEVHVAGLTSEPEKKRPWGSKTQQQSGSRWLLVNDVGKNNKHQLMKSKAPAKTSSLETSKGQPGESLWSISSRVFGGGAKAKDTAANPHVRNPNVIFPTIKLGSRYRPGLSIVSIPYLSFSPLSFWSTGSCETL